MRRAATLLILPLLLASGQALRAQSPHLGFSVNLTIPTGDFASKTYLTTTGHEKETYDLGLGGSFTASFPVDRNLAFRLDLSGSSETGVNRAAGYSDLNLRHSLFSVGGDLQIFPQGTAFRHRGLYFVAGLSADFEQFSRGYGNDYYYYNDSSSTSKSRLGGKVGIGHSFGFDAGRKFTVEATYHTTLTSKDVNAGDPPSTDFLKLGFGLVF